MADSSNGFRWLLWPQFLIACSVMGIATWMLMLETHYVGTLTRVIPVGAWPAPIGVWLQGGYAMAMDITCIMMVVISILLLVRKRGRVVQAAIVLVIAACLVLCLGQAAACIYCLDCAAGGYGW